MKKWLALTLLTLIFLKGFSQNLAWADGISGAGDDIAVSITTDVSGNVYTTGSFEGSVDFDPGAGIYTLTSQGNRDIFITKEDASGNFLWAKTFGGIANDYSNVICYDPSGNLYLSGTYGGTVDFDPGVGTYTLSSAGSNDIFILKLSISGNMVWVKTIGAAGGDFARSLVLDALGNVYTTGMFEGTVDFNPGPGVYTLTTSNASAFISKLDASGNFIWAKASAERAGAIWSDYVVPVSIVVDAAQNVYTTGDFYGVVDFDPGISTYTINAASNIVQTFISKLNASGNFVWAKSIVSQNEIVECQSQSIRSQIFTWVVILQVALTLISVQDQISLYPQVVKIYF